MKDRPHRLVAQLSERELDAMLISAPENRRYLSGFTGSAGYLLLTAGNAVLVTDSRYTEQATGQAPDYQVMQVKGGWDWLMELLKEKGIKRLGFESQHMTVATYNDLLDAVKGKEDLGQVSLVASSGITVLSIWGYLSAVMTPPRERDEKSSLYQDMYGNSLDSSASS